MKLFIWKISHNALPTNSTIFHRNLSSDSVCIRRLDVDEDAIHCLHDCGMAHDIWTDLGMANKDDFMTRSVYQWIRKFTYSDITSLFVVGMWWIWKHRNMVFFMVVMLVLSG
jgi:hypothetical protein